MNLDAHSFGKLYVNINHINMYIYSDEIAILLLYTNNYIYIEKERES